MKPLRKHLKLIALFLAVTFLMQSCVVYQKTPTSLEQASKKDLKVKLITKNNETYKYHRIIFEEGKYYAILKINGEKRKISFYTNGISQIHLQNKTASVIQPFAISIVIIAALIFYSKFPRYN